MSNKIKKLNDFIEDEERRRVTTTAYDIPGDWKIVRLGEYAEIFGGTTPPKRNPNYWNGKIPWATPTDITSLRSNFINDTSEKITEKAVKECSLRIIEPGNVLLTSRATIGFAAINTTPMTINQGITAIIPNKNKIDSLFLVYLLRYMKKILEQLAGGSTFKEISRSTLRSLKIPLPPIDEQRRIAEVLSTVDEAIRLVDESIAGTERLKKGLMQELLTKGIGHKEFKQTEIGKIPKEWKIVKLGKILVECYRYPTYYNITYVDKGIPEIRGELLKDGQIENDPKKIRYVSEETAKKFPRVRLMEGDLVISVRGTMGKVGYVPKELEGAIITANLMRLSPNKQLIHSKYLLHCLLSEKFRFILNALSPYTTIKTIQASVLKSIPIPLPPLSEQQKIAEILSAIDEKLNLEKKRKRVLEQVKKALMDLLLIGKVRLKVSENV
ncbi:MAG: restriction endonuclease subunit S [Thaumarchaeota archaeon]|nr:MAG: restriction endonuclease subunit S [Nitrososphaerota archaeon]